MKAGYEQEGRAAGLLQPFTRIRAQKPFDNRTLPNATPYSKTEWWHFQYAVG